MNESERKIEEQHLRGIEQIAEKYLQEELEKIENQEKEMQDAKREVRENTLYGVGDLNDNDNFEALVELKQTMDQVTKLIGDHDTAHRRVASLKKIINKPYFARIDFTFEDGYCEEIYIGRIPLTDKKTKEILVYDWRSPIAGVYYRFMPGPAFYDAPAGRIEGELERKRQYEIKDGQLEYFFEADVNIQDEILRQMLAKNTSPKMKAIVETIQGEQDRAIRDVEKDLLMVNGVAGSGKTSIALHRAAYFLYEGLQNKLLANNIMIVSPNEAFEEYISDVLPELGEENVTTTVFFDIMRNVVKGKYLQSYHDYLESAFSGTKKGQLARKSMAFKCSPVFAKMLDLFIEKLPEYFLEYPDLTAENFGTLSGDVLRRQLMKRADIPLGNRLEQLQTFAFEHFFGTGPIGANWEIREKVREQMQPLVNPDFAQLYSKIFTDRSIFEELKQAVGCTDDLEDIRKFSAGRMEPWQIYYDDVCAVAYMLLRIYGSDAFRHIRQVVIDEAQDYYPLQYDIFRMLFPNARFTVLGDVNQTLAKQETLAFYDMVKMRLGKKNAALFTLNKSFRCTTEILSFGAQFLEQGTQIESFNRSGDTPKIHCLPDAQSHLDAILTEIAECEEKGYESICLLCKTERNARELFHRLKECRKVSFFSGHNTENLQGVLVMPAYLSKGLEFDAVLICDADNATYKDADDKKVLYVESTRALHRLNLFCVGDVTELVAQ